MANAPSLEKEGAMKVQNSTTLVSCVAWAVLSLTPSYADPQGILLTGGAAIGALA
jgi:hypothetical protein